MLFVVVELFTANILYNIAQHFSFGHQQVNVLFSDFEVRIIAGFDIGSVFVGKEKRRKEQVSSSQIFDSLFCICSEQ